MADNELIEIQRILFLVLERLDRLQLILEPLVLVLEKNHAEFKDTLQIKYTRTNILVENKLGREQRND